jgi:PEP-CTERM motif
MKLRLLALAATAATALAASSANAGIVATFDPLAWGLNAGEADITQFEGGPALSQVTFSQPGYSLSGTGQLFTNTVSGISAAPAMPATSNVIDPATGRDATQYLSIQGGQSVTLSLAGLTEISFYIGSLDGYNSLAFEYADGTFAPVMTGSWVTDNTIAQSNGDQQNGNTNGRLTLTFDKPVESVVLSSSTNAFEISDVAGIKAAVPEPASWALMIAGFGGAGAVLRGQRRRQAVAATA